MSESTEEPLTALLAVLARFRDCEPSGVIAAVAAPDGGTLQLTYGDLLALAAQLLDHRSRANRVAREAADLRDERDSALSELEELRERYADLASDRDVLTVELEDARRQVAAYEFPEVSR